MFIGFWVTRFFFFIELLDRTPAVANRDCHRSRETGAIRGDFREPGTPGNALCIPRVPNVMVPE